MKLAELGEFGLIQRIAARVEPRKGREIGIGDDAAAIEPTVGMQTLVSTDMLVEGVHFDLTFTDPYRLGRKALAVNLSDIAAMGGEPQHLLLGMAIPPGMGIEFLDSFIDGLLGLAKEFDVLLIGGDTCASSCGFTVSLTIIGEQRPERVVSRSGARPGDLLMVSGTIGDAALGLRLLKRGERCGLAITRQLDPHPRVREGMMLAAAGVPTAMIDVSDGLLADLGHIMENSGIGAQVELAALPLSSELLEITGALDMDPYELALAGGEDYELLFTVPPERLAAAMATLSPCGVSVTKIGTITESLQLRVVSADGSEYRPKSYGYNHFTTVD